MQSSKPKYVLLLASIIISLMICWVNALPIAQQSTPYQPHCEEWQILLNQTTYKNNTYIPLLFKKNGSDMLYVFSADLYTDKGAAKYLWQATDNTKLYFDNTGTASKDVLLIVPSDPEEDYELTNGANPTQFYIRSWGTTNGDTHCATLSAPFYVSP
ncbi:14298_t:CDS:2 [Ambispora leptoticha]|uniref:14298_t:CDS:1 n=1 Tax=Ambispora leptoticha TaxID=144679 RepID=A0A9N9B0I3_9GLOM|nr:14298_t:CDS:2 [Ambispora leptoticha]